MCLGVPGKITEIYENAGMSMGRIDFGGVTREVCLAYVPEAKIGDYAMIHVGFALNLMSEAEANEFARSAAPDRGRGGRALS